jgi:hypothetical protein
LAPKIETFLAKLKEAVADVQNTDPPNLKHGMAGINGMAGSIPQGPVNDLWYAYLDVGLMACQYCPIISNIFTLRLVFTVLLLGTT